VNADVWVVGWDDTSPLDDAERRERVEKPVLVELKAHHSSVKFKLFANCIKRPVRIHAHSHHGSINMVLPPSFRGPVTLDSKNGSITLSDAIKARLTMFSDVGGVRRCFIGNLTEEGYGKDEWKGSTLDASSHHGGLILSCTEEVKAKPSPGFFSKIVKYLDAM